MEVRRPETEVRSCKMRRQGDEAKSAFRCEIFIEKQGIDGNPSAEMRQSKRQSRFGRNGKDEKAIVETERLGDEERGQIRSSKRYLLPSAFRRRIKDQNG